MRIELAATGPADLCGLEGPMAQARQHYGASKQQGVCLLRMRRTRYRFRVTVSPLLDRDAAGQDSTKHVSTSGGKTYILGNNPNEFRTRAPQRDPHLLQVGIRERRVYPMQDIISFLARVLPRSLVSSLIRTNISFHSREIARPPLPSPPARYVQKRLSTDLERERLVCCTKREKGQLDSKNIASSPPHSRSPKNAR